MLKNIFSIIALVAAVFLIAGPLVAADGAAVYLAQKCQLCHSIAGKGTTKSPLDGVGKKLTTEAIKKWIVAPKQMKADTKMKAYPNLSPADLEALIAYMVSLK
jgi:cytochrome c oxidase subunit 2